MISSTFTTMKITGVSAAVPNRQVSAHEYDDLFGMETVEKNITSTGVKTSFHASEKQTASDLAFVAAEKLLNEFAVPREKIGILLFTGSYLDYVVPPTACVLHARLGLSPDCIVYDIDLACSGYVYSLQTLCSLLQCTDAEYGLLLTGDITSKKVSPLDKSRMLFGDAGTATLVQKCADAPIMRFGMKTDGCRFKSIIIPAGASRCPDGQHERTEWGDGNTRSDYDLYMNGTDVFSFTMTDVPALVKEFMEHYSVSSDDYDAFVFHQPNLFILKHLAKKIKAPLEKMPISLDRYGNTSGNAIPLTICDTFAGKGSGEKKLFIYGFGVGLSWACAEISLDTAKVLTITHTDDFYNEGFVSHQ